MKKKLLIKELLKTTTMNWIWDMLMRLFSNRQNEMIIYAD